jgi:hypothetical protein
MQQLYLLILWTLIQKIGQILHGNRWKWPWVTTPRMISEPNNKTRYHLIVWWVIGQHAQFAKTDKGKRLKVSKSSSSIFFCSMADRITALWVAMVSHNPPDDKSCYTSVIQWPHPTLLNHWIILAPLCIKCSSASGAAAISSPWRFHRSGAKTDGSVGLLCWSDGLETISSIF